MKYMIKTAFLFLVCAALQACDEYLDESPSKSQNIEITTVAQLTALLDENAYGGGTVDSDIAHIFCSDCYAMTTAVYDGFAMREAPVEISQMMTWQMPMLANTNDKVSEWASEYSNIYLANLVLASLDKVSGSAEEKAEVKGRAHALRAYCYLELVNTYCMPYGASTLDTYGLPLKSQPNYEESLKRGTLAGTYAFIESDIRQAIKLTTTVMQNGKREAWRESGAMANATAARFFLNMGNYSDAQQCAEKALELGGDELLNLRTGEVGQTLDLITGVTIPETTAPSQSYKTYVPDMDRAYYFRTTYTLMTMVWAIPSDYLLSLFDKQYDLRYKLFVVPDFHKYFMFGMFGMFFTENVAGYTTYGYQFSGAPNSAEMRLIKAECLARQNQVGPAMQTLNDLRATRFDAAAPASVVNISATSKDQAIRYILEERAREFPFTQRWNDIRRCNFNDDPNDDIRATRSFYTVGQYGVDTAIKTYTLTPDVRNTYAVAIPNAEISAGNGEIKQNEY